MDCTTLTTAAEILEAFRTCSNAGEPIELFECLATRPNPPVGAFVEILENIRLEVVLALTIQAFGQIADAETKARLKQSKDLLTMLSQQAQSGSTDLIRWAAATAIETVGFDFIAVSRHLSEDPQNIAEKIVQSKVKRLAEQNLINSDDYDGFIRFWIYGPRYKLREVSRGDFWHSRQNWQREKGRGYNSYFDVCWQVMTALDFRGLKEINTGLKRAEAMGDNALAIDENEIFEGMAQVIAADKLKEQLNYGEADLLIEIQLRCLQSNNPETRKAAALEISSLGNNFLDELKRSSPLLALAISIFREDLFSSNQYSRKTSNFLETLAEDIESLSRNMGRKKVRQDCQTYHSQVLKTMAYRKTAIQNLENQLNQIKSININLYIQVFQKVENQFFEDAINGSYVNFRMLRNEVDKFYSDFSDIQSEIEKLDKEWRESTLEERASFYGFLISSLVSGVLWLVYGNAGVIVFLIVWFVSYIFLKFIGQNRSSYLLRNLLEKKSFLDDERKKMDQERLKVIKLLGI